jgi:cell division protein FtsI (penicillin-binding protein 3)
LKELPVLNGIMPNIKGMGLRDALYLLENMGLKVRVNGFGKVTDQSIQVGAKVKQGDAVYLTLRN